MSGLFLTPQNRTMRFTARMSPSDFAQEELAAWQLALEEQHEAERDALEAREAGEMARFIAALNRLDELRSRADRLLSVAVAKKRSMS